MANSAANYPRVPSALASRPRLALPAGAGLPAVCARPRPALSHTCASVCPSLSALAQVGCFDWPHINVPSFLGFIFFLYQQQHCHSLTRFVPKLSAVPRVVESPV